jgi:hypothetical protein
MKETIVAVVSVYRHITLILTILLACSAGLNVVQYIMGEDQQAQIEYLEEYIEDNQWPTPFWPLPDIDIDIRRK